MVISDEKNLTLKWQFAIDFSGKSNLVFAFYFSESHIDVKKGKKKKPNLRERFHHSGKMKEETGSDVYNSLAII